MDAVKRGWIGVGLALAVAWPAQAQESYTLSGDRVAVYNVAGEVRVVPGNGGDVVVRVSPGGSDASQLSVEVDRIDGRMTLRVMYPGDQVVYDMEGRGRYRTQLRMRSNGTWGGGGRGGDRMEVRSSGSGLEAHADLVIQVPAGRDVSVYNAVGRVEAEGVQGDLELDVHAGPVRASQIRGDLSVDTGSGSVWVMGVEGEVEVDTGSGSVEIADVAGAQVFVDTGSGGVEANGIRTNRLEVDTGSGRVELARIDAPDVMVDTGSGSVDVELLGRVENVEVDTGSGSVTIRVPESLNAEIEVDTGSGGIDVDFPVTMRTMRRNYFRGVAGDGSGRILVDTGSGRIRLIQG